MTSFGIEWETNALVREIEVQEKTPAKSGNGWSITFEGREFFSSRDGLKHEPPLNSDCHYNLEVQIGPVFSDTPTQFNQRNVLRGISEFNREVWNRLVQERKISVNGKDLQVVSYRVGKVDIPRFIDCNLTEAGFLFDKNGNEWGYIKSLDDLIGKVQYTIGIRLEFVPKLFEAITYLVDECNVDITNCGTIVHKKFLNFIPESYKFVKAFETQYSNPISNSVIGVLLQFWYSIRTEFELNKTKGIYFKALFHLKPRSNLGTLCSQFNSEQIRIFMDFTEFAKQKSPELTGLIIKMLDKMGKMKEGYRLIPLSEKNRIVKGLLGTLDIFTASTSLLSQLDVEKVHYCDIIPRKLTEKDGKIKVSFPINHGEWIGSEQNVYFEFRSPETIISLLDKRLYNEYRERMGREKQGMYSISRLSVITNIFIQEFLNKIFI